MRSSVVLALAAAVLALPAAADDSALKINFPKDSPLSLISADWGESKASPRGGAMVLDVHASLSLKNSTQRRVRGVNLLVLAQDVTPGGRASVGVPSLDIPPGEVFPVRIDLRLLRPLQSGTGPLVQVSLDGVLFDDLSFFGEDKLNSRRSLTGWEMEARRDRRYFKSILEAKGAEGLQKEMLSALSRMADRPRLDVQMARGGRATAFEPEREIQFTFLQLPDAPVEALGGVAHISGNEARAPSLEVRNKSSREVRFMEMGLILHDRNGAEYLAGTVPASVSIAPGQKGRAAESSTMRFTAKGGRPLSIEGMTGFVSQVQFADGQIWVPSRAALADPKLSQLIAPSPEEQRLLELYRKRGIQAVVEQLNRY